MPAISSYPAATAVTADDVFIGNDGSTTKKFPATTVRTYALGATTVDTFNTPTTYDHAVQRIHIAGHGTKTVEERHNGVYVKIQDDAAVVTKTITGAANNGSGLIRLTATAHGLVNGDGIAVWGVGGVTNANGSWIITGVSTNTVDLVGSTFSGTYTSGGTLSNRPMMYGVTVNAEVNQPRGGMTGTVEFADDVNCFVGYNSGTSKGTDAYYLGRNALIAGSEWTVGFTIDANCDYGVRTNGAFEVGLDFNVGTYSVGQLRLKNDSYVVGRDPTNTSNIQMFKINTLGEMQIDAVTRYNTHIILTDYDTNLFFGTTIGSKIGTQPTEKLSFWGATPVVQPTAVANATDAASAITQLNALLTRLRTIGLVAT